MVEDAADVIPDGIVPDDSSPGAKSFAQIDQPVSVIVRFPNHPSIIHAPTPRQAPLAVEFPVVTYSSGFKYRPRFLTS